jgi:hypothetical protein
MVKPPRLGRDVIGFSVLVLVVALIQTCAMTMQSPPSHRHNTPQGRGRPPVDRAHEQGRFPRERACVRVGSTAGRVGMGG